MPPPMDSSLPRLAAGCRWGGSGEDRVILFPEGAIRLEGPGQHVLERCDGQRTFREIVGELQSQYSGSDPAEIQRDAASFLERLQRKRIVDY